MQISDGTGRSQFGATITALPAKEERRQTRVALPVPQTPLEVMIAAAVTR